VLKERFRTFCAYRYPGAAWTFFTRWYWRASQSRLKPMAAVAKLIPRPVEPFSDWAQVVLRPAVSGYSRQETSLSLRSSKMIASSTV
jgi:hypothetical protein